MARLGGQLRLLPLLTKNIFLALLTFRSDYAVLAEQSADVEVCQAATQTESCRSFIQKPDRRALIQKDHGVLVTSETVQQDSDEDTDSQREPFATIASSQPRPRQSRSPQRAPRHAALPAVHHVKLPKSPEKQPSDLSRALDSVLAAVEYEAEILDIPMPMVMHRKVARGEPLVSKGTLKGWAFWQSLLSLIIIIFCLLSCCLICGLRFKSPSRDKMIKRPPNLNPHTDGVVEKDQELFGATSTSTHTGIGTEALHAIQMLFPSSSRGEEKRMLTVRALAGSPLRTWSENSFDYSDASGRAVLRANVTVPNRVQWYQQWYYQWQRDGLGNVLRATPIGKIFGVSAREHPAISIFSLMQEDVGPVFARCRAIDEEDSKRGKRYFFYDKEDEQFAVLSWDPAQHKGHGGRYQLVSLSSLGQNYMVECSSDLHRVTFSADKPDRPELIASTEPCAASGLLATDTARFYRIHFHTEATWQMSVLVLLAFMAVEMDRTGIGDTAVTTQQST